MVRLLFFVVSKVVGRGYLMNVGWSVENVVNFYKYFFKVNRYVNKLIWENKV